MIGYGTLTKTIALATCFLAVGCMRLEGDDGDTDGNPAAKYNFETLGNDLDFSGNLCNRDRAVAMIAQWQNLNTSVFGGTVDGASKIYNQYILKKTAAPKPVTMANTDELLSCRTTSKDTGSIVYRLWTTSTVKETSGSGCPIYAKTTTLSNTSLQSSVDVQFDGNDYHSAGFGEITEARMKIAQSRYNVSTGYVDYDYAIAGTMKTRSQGEVKILTRTKLDGSGRRIESTVRVGFGDCSSTLSMKKKVAESNATVFFDGAQIDTVNSY